MLFTHISVWSIIIPILIFLFNGKIFKTDLKYFVILVFVSFIADSFNIVLYYNRLNSYPVSYIYALVSFDLISMYYMSISKSKLINGVIKIQLWSFSVYWIVNILFFNSILDNNSILNYIIGILVVIILFFHYYELFYRQEVENLSKEPSFIITSTLLLYYAGTLFIHITRDIITDEDFIYYYYKIHSTLHLFLNIGLAWVFWLGAKQLVSKNKFKTF